MTNSHPKLQSHRYRSMRTLAFVATGVSVVVPLIHGLNIFGLDLMKKKAFTYTMVAKMGCLLSGTALYVVSFTSRPYKRNIDSNTHDSKDEVSRKLVAWKI
jgi:adiponectin receptor